MVQVEREEILEEEKKYEKSHFCVQFLLIKLQ